MERILIVGNIDEVSDELKKIIATYGDTTIGWVAPIVRFNQACDKLIANLYKYYGGRK